MKRQVGLSLIELLIAMVLGLFLVFALVNVFVGQKRTSDVEKSLARLQENARIALDLLASDIRDANYIGCNSASGSLILMANGATFTGILGWERDSDGWSPALPAALNDISNTNRIGSDVINIQHARDLGSRLTAPVVAATTELAIDNNPDCIQTGEHVILGSCNVAHMFEVTNAPSCNDGNTTFEFGAVGNAITSILPDYTVDEARLMQFVDKTWYVRDTGRRHTELDIPVFALYRRVDGQEIEMVAGVEFLQLSYGELLSGGNIRYVKADDANLDFENDEIVAVRIALLIQSYELVLNEPDSNSYQALDQAIGVSPAVIAHNGDRTLRRVFSTTTLLRN